MSELLPEGVSDIKDAPYTFFSAIRTALVVLSFDQLDKDERPPRRLWMDSDGLNEWFNAVERRRRAKYGTADRAPIEDPVENPLMKDLIRE